MGELATFIAGMPKAEFEDAALIKEINRRGLGLTLCPISNSYVTDGLKAVEIKSMLDEGVRATINFDDPACSLAT